MDFVGSHGHTVFHQPERALTLQIGNGAHLAEHCKLPVVNDFRQADIAAGGQGAPLVPIGDQLLFSHYAACLNLGGIANISFDSFGGRKAFDICPCNLVLNKLANKERMGYDRGGGMARSGNTLEPLLMQLNALEYYHQAFPKSFSREWDEVHCMPLLQMGKTNDLLNTFVAHIAEQIATVCHNYISHDHEILLSGGGVHNRFLLDQIKERVGHSHRIVTENDTLTDFKEAMIFAFLAVLHIRKEVNTLKSVTGARHNSSGGMVHGIAYFY